MWKQLKPGRVEIGLALFAGLYALLRVLSASPLLELAALLAVLGFAGAALVKLARAASRRLLWRLRNRMIVVYLVSAVIPALLAALIIGYGARLLAGQIAVYMVHAELERRLDTMSEIAMALAEAPEGRRNAMVDRVHDMFQTQGPGTTVVVQADDDNPEASPPSGWGQIRGLVRKGEMLYAWSRVVAGHTRVTILTPLTRAWLAKLVPNIGQVSVVHFNARNRQRMKVHQGDESDDDSPEVPPPVHTLDFDILWGTNIPVAVWDTPQQEDQGLLAVHSRLSAVLGILYSLKTNSPVPVVLYLFGVGLIVVELMALVLGVSLTRATTQAVHNLYEGTQRVMKGDFAHRIEVRGNEQVAELSRSFNLMTENLERLVAVAKEKERMEAELEIAREVQGQLFPRFVPTLPGLQLSAVCKPALAVSGDYYDYQSLRDGCLAIAVGDVAGKGISAALLMAMLQSSLRTQFRQALESGNGDGISTAAIMSRLNKQLHADTAPEKYATFFLALYHDDSGLLTYTNAGHLPPLLIRRGQVLRSDINGMVVGAFPHAQYDESTVLMEADDLFVCYTDGVTEPENEFGEMFGEERLVEILLRSCQLQPRQIMDNVIEEVQKFTGSPELQDDLTILIARRNA
ncbi:MAG: HAMP domain-containing protein [Acidimicrobiia bacterium]|nr:HAMP domain-containing protein [Acidimicrobiia bacterium]